jgi:hypothetical protein
MPSLVTATCIIVAANTYNIEPIVIAAIMKTEGGKIGSYSQNSNDTKDLGPMQINDKVWTGPIADEFFNGDKALAKEQLLNNGCFNVRAGAWILRENIDQSGGDLMTGIGRYHSWTEKHKIKYQRLFLNSLRKLIVKKR